MLCVHVQCVHVTLCVWRCQGASSWCRRALIAAHVWGKCRPRAADVPCFAFALLGSWLSQACLAFQGAFRVQAVHGLYGSGEMLMSCLHDRPNCGFVPPKHRKCWKNTESVGTKQAARPRVVQAPATSAFRCQASLSPTGINQHLLLCCYLWLYLHCCLCLLSFATSSHNWQHLYRHIRNVIPCRCSCSAPCVCLLSIVATVAFLFVSLVKWFASCLFALAASWLPAT